MIYWLYNLFLSLFSALFLPVLSLVFLSRKRVRKGFLQRIGFYPRETTEAVRGSRPIWIHAVSVGEVMSARFLAGQLRERLPGRKILISTVTSTGSEIARQTGAGDMVIHFPLDHPWIVRRALTVFDPSLLIFLETEIWPNFLRLAYRKGIPILLLSGRISPGAFRRYSFFRPFFSKVVRHFTAVGMQSEDDAERMVHLGCDPRRVMITGSLKHAVSQEGERSDGSHGARVLIQGRGDRQILVVGSTHRGEEEILLDVFLFLKSRFPALQMVLAPRHPQRFDEVERLLKKSEVQYEKMSQMNGRQGGFADVIFLDTLGDLLDFYSVADVAFIGGSLMNAGGHNLMEPARFRKPVLFGPYMTNFADIAEEMKRKGGGVEVRGREDLIREISGLLTDRAKAESMGRIAYSVVEGDRGVMDRSLELVSRYLHP